MDRRRKVVIGLAAMLLVAAGITVATLTFRPAVILPTVSSRSPDPGAAVDLEAWSAVEWRVVADPFPKGDPEPLRIDGLVDAAGLLIGWGRVAAIGPNQFNEMGAVFVSADAVHWRAIPLNDGVPAGDTSEPHGVAAGPLGFIVWGGVCCRIEEGATWGSRDGITWTRVRAARPPAGILDIAASTRGWVGVGTAGDKAAIWNSADGGVWEAVDLAPADSGKGDISDVERLGDRLVAVGTLDDANGTHDGAVWTSDDGLTWSRLAVADPTLTGPDETELSRVLPFGGGLFVVGNHGSHDERVRCEQLTGSTASLVATPPETALSCGWGREHHWLSDDGSKWRRLAPFDPLPGEPADPTPHPLEFRLVVPGGGGLIDVGEDNVPPDDTSSVWVALDGSAWRRVDSFGRLPQAGSPSGIAVRGNTIVVVGEADEPGRGVSVRIGTAR